MARRSAFILLIRNTPTRRILPVISQYQLRNDFNITFGELISCDRFASYILSQLIVNEAIVKRDGSHVMVMEKLPHVVRDTLQMPSHVILPLTRPALDMLINRALVNIQVNVEQSQLALIHKKYTSEITQSILPDYHFICSFFMKYDI